MSDCPEERSTQHYRGEWCGFGPVADDEHVIFAVFQKTKCREQQLAQDSFDNSNLKMRTQSLARGAFVSRSIFNRKIVDALNQTKGPLIGIALADVSKIRAIPAKINLNNTNIRVRALCVLDRVERGDCDGHATVGFSEATNLPISQGQLGKMRARIKLDLADTFSEIKQPGAHRWPNYWCIPLKRIASIARVLRAKILGQTLAE